MNVVLYFNFIFMCPYFQAHLIYSWYFDSMSDFIGFICHLLTVYPPLTIICFVFQVICLKLCYFYYVIPDYVEG